MPNIISCLNQEEHVIIKKKQNLSQQDPTIDYDFLTPLRVHIGPHIGVQWEDTPRAYNVLPFYMLDVPLNI